MLNKPFEINKGTDNIAYIYSAQGEKLAKKMKDNSYQYYAGTMVYKNDRSLNYLLMDEGMVNKVSGGYAYEYHLKDHLGNTRVAFQPNGSATTVTQATEYYPFGMNYMPHSPAGSNKYLYNGKEKQDDVLSTTALDWYDYGNRFYDPQIARWQKIDPKAEIYKNLTPYCYAANTPLNAIDPDGNVVIFINGQHGGNGGSSAYWFDSKLGRHFDYEVQAHFKDFSPSSHQYLDGAMGGWWNNNFASPASWMSNKVADNRRSAGYRYGNKYAMEILKSLHRTKGVIDESIKVVSHSMGGAYAKGFINALIEYAEANPELSNGLRISEFDFDRANASKKYCN